MTAPFTLECLRRTSVKQLSLGVTFKNQLWWLFFKKSGKWLLSRFLYTCFVVPAREGSAALHVVWMFLLLPILSENGFSLLEIDFVCLTSDSLTTDQYFVETFTCCLFTITKLYLCYLSTHGELYETLLSSRWMAKLWQ